MPSLLSYDIDKTGKNAMNVISYLCLWFIKAIQIVFLLTRMSNDLFPLPYHLPILDPGFMKDDAFL